MEEVIKRAGIGSAVVSACSLTIGGALNQLVEVMNKGKMPVYGDICAILPGITLDKGHVCASVNTHLGILADWIVSGRYVMSVGDIFLDISAYTGLIAGIILLGLGLHLLVKKLWSKADAH